MMTPEGIGKDVLQVDDGSNCIPLLIAAIIPDFQCSRRDPASQGRLVLRVICHPHRGNQQKSCSAWRSRRS